MSDDGQRVVVVELVVELVRVGVEESGLRRFGIVVVVLLRRVLLLAGVVCVAALRTEAAGTERSTDGVLMLLPSPGKAHILHRLVQSSAHKF